jgi:hypothetical protein
MDRYPPQTSYNDSGQGGKKNNSLSTITMRYFELIVDKIVDNCPLCCFEARLADSGQDSGQLANMGEKG